MLRNIASAAFVGAGLLVASVSAAGAAGFGLPRAVPLYLSGHPGALDDALTGTSGQASLNPVCRPWPPFGYLCTAGSGSGDADEMPAGRIPAANAAPQIQLARGFGCIYTDWAGTGYGVPC
jgi:hypothetical protein